MAGGDRRGACHAEFRAADRAPLRRRDSAPTRRQLSSGGRLDRDGQRLDDIAPSDRRLRARHAREQHCHRQRRHRSDPYDTGTFASTGTVVAGQAVEKTASALRDVLIDFAAPHFGCEPADCRLQEDADRLRQPEDAARRTPRGRQPRSATVSMSSARPISRRVGRLQRAWRARRRPSRHRRDHDLAKRARCRHRQADQSHAVPRPARRRHRHGLRLGALREDGLSTINGAMLNPALRDYRIPAFADVPRSEIYFADTYDKSGHSAPRRKANAPSIAWRRRSPTPWPTPPACASPACHCRPSASSTGSDHERARCQGGDHRHADADAIRKDAAFAEWQQRMSAAVAAQAGFIKETIIPPSPPAQIDWVILQRFASRGAAVTWLRSGERQRLLAETQAILIGPDDMHLVTNSGAGALPAPVSAVISTRIKPGQRRRLSRMGPAHRRSAVEVAGLSRLSARTARPRCAGRLAGHPAVRFRSEPPDLAELARAQETARRVGSLHR